ncbi:hypothetical protein ACHHYP_16294 [Achlya hypogyna]|uniref:Uncharacterized protein n=1 Tax=Achlya hypogyna TaxID=1202772 RepID=A0A1V9Y983_ACHHY|nr:hypothetical protein ACHHYP_16294 [Achlya hypogyna]
MRATAKLIALSCTPSEYQERWTAIKDDTSPSSTLRGDTIILDLLAKDLSHGEVRAVLPVAGGSRTHRLSKVLAGKVPVVPQPSRADHAFPPEVLQAIYDDAELWPREEGFACSHRLQKHYLVEPNITFKKLHKRYKMSQDAKSQPSASYSPWLQYIHMTYPSLRVQRAAEDDCDSCVRISILLQQPDFSELDRATLIAEQQMHIDAAISQRRAMSFFVHDYVAKIDPSQCLPATIIPDHCDVAFAADDVTVPLATGGGGVISSVHDTAGGDALVVAPTVQVQIEDFGDSFSCPYYGVCRPSADYYNSNLMMHNFVTTDISRNINKIVFYDERGQG